MMRLGERIEKPGMSMTACFFSSLTGSPPLLRSFTEDTPIVPYTTASPIDPPTTIFRLAGRLGAPSPAPTSSPASTRALHASRFSFSFSFRFPHSSTQSHCFRFNSTQSYLVNIKTARGAVFEKCHFLYSFTYLNIPIIQDHMFIHSFPSFFSIPLACYVTLPCK